MRAESAPLDEEVEALLTDAGLPVSDLSSTRDLQLFGVREGGHLVGVVGIESYGPIGLLRSLAVVGVRRSSGLGARLVSDAEIWAAEQAIQTLYLLTTTAAGFFAKLGYEVIPRSAAPAAIAATAQFSGLCPSSSTFMRKVLHAGDAVQARRP